MNISDVFNLYVSSVEASRATSTVDTYKYKLNTAKKNLEYEDTEKVTKEVAQAFIDNLSEKYATKTVRGIYDVVNAAFRFAASNGSIKSNPFEDCHVNPVEYHVPVILSEEQAEELLKAANYNQSLYIPILIAILTGLRRSQVLALTWGDIDFSNARNPDDITIKFNPILTNYLGIDLEEEANKASSFSFANKKELIFTISLQNNNCKNDISGV